MAGSFWRARWVAATLEDRFESQKLVFKQSIGAPDLQFEFIFKVSKGKGEESKVKI